jgi:hypothetical protein
MTMVRAACCIAMLAGWVAVARADPAGPEELNVFGVYATSFASGHPKGIVTVEVDRLAPQTLVLGAYEETMWLITVAKGAHLRRVIATGYRHQTVRAPDGVDVVTYSGADHYLSASGNPGWGGGLGSGHAALVTAAEAVTHLRVTSYHGCGRATAVIQHADGTLTADCTDGSGKTVHAVPVDHALPPQLPIIADSEVRFRAGLVARCGNWDAIHCAGEGAILVLDKDARAAHVGIELAGKRVADRGVLPIRVPPKTRVAIVRDGRRTALAIKDGEVWIVGGAGPSQHTAADSELGLAGNADVLSQIVGAVGGAVCMGNCVLHRDRAGLFYLLDWLSTFDDLGLTELEVAAAH